jgi:gliding motility-associated-like protein
MPGGVAVFTNTSTIPSNGTLSYKWDFGDGTGTSTAVNPSHVYAAAGSYNVQLTAASDYGCRKAVTKTADRFSGRPLAAFTVAPAEICQGGTVKFTDASTAPGSTVAGWSWNLGNGSTSAAKAPTATYTAAGKAIPALVVKNAQGCISFPATATITVHQQPVIDAGASFMVKEGDQVQFTATSNSNSYQFLWVPAAGLSSPTALQPVLKVKEDVVYTLTAAGEFGCTASDTMSVKLLRNIAPPNAFTPNGDGIHDVWEIPYLNAWPGATVDVFNRYGQSVYHSAGYSKPWDGKMNGKEVPSGTYYYVINLGRGMGTLTGPVTIIR